MAAPDPPRSAGTGRAPVSGRSRPGTGAEPLVAASQSRPVRHGFVSAGDYGRSKMLGAGERSIREAEASAQEARRAADAPPSGKAGCPRDPRCSTKATILSTELSALIAPYPLV